MSWRSLLMITLLAQLPYFVDAQVHTVYAGAVELPQGPVTRIPSPNRRWTLILECPDNCRERKLWAEDSTSHARKPVKEYARSLAIVWAPDSERFFVNDDYGSNGSDSYVVEPASLKTIDLGAVIADNDARATQFLRAGHSYVRAKRWLNSHELLVVLFGHFDDSPPHGVQGSFTIRYRVDLKGGAREISWNSTEEPQ